LLIYQWHFLFTYLVVFFRHENTRLNTFNVKCPTCDKKIINYFSLVSITNSVISPTVCAPYFCFFHEKSELWQNISMWNLDAPVNIWRWTRIHGSRDHCKLMNGYCNRYNVEEHCNTKISIQSIVLTKSVCFAYFTCAS